MEIVSLGHTKLLHPSMRAKLRHLNKKHFQFANSLLLAAHWWWIAREDDLIVAIAGASDEGESRIGMGPCGVLPAFQRRGLQADLIMERELFGIAHAFRFAVTSTSADNYTSANNFIRAGYLLTPAWKPFETESEFLFFRKTL